MPKVQLYHVTDTGTAQVPGQEYDWDGASAFIDLSPPEKQFFQGKAGNDHVAWIVLLSQGIPGDPPPTGLGVDTGILPSRFHMNGSATEGDLGDDDTPLPGKQPFSGTIRFVIHWDEPRIKK